MFNRNIKQNITFFTKPSFRVLLAVKKQKQTAMAQHGLKPLLFLRNLRSTTKIPKYFGFSKLHYILDKISPRITIF